MENIDKVRKRSDGWENLATGLGTKADKRRYTRITPDGSLSDEELSAIYTSDGLAAKIVDTIPDDMTRQGWTYEYNKGLKNEDEADAGLNEITDSLELQSKVNLALKWARLYGGSVIVLAALDGSDLSSPLNPSRIRYFDGLRVIDRSNIEYDNIKFQTDPNQINYGKPELYPINFGLNGNYSITYVHASRVIEVHGREIPLNYKTRAFRYETKYWGLSELQFCHKEIAQIAQSFGGISQLLDEISVGKYKFKDLADILASPDGTKMLEKRIENADLIKSVFHSVYMDSEEDYMRENVTLSGVSDVLYQYFMKLSAVTGYPITRLFGVSPAGLNSTGEGDMLNYYDVVRNKQSIILKPILDRIISVICDWKGFEKPEIKFNPLKQLSEKEEAELELSRQQANSMKWEAYQKAIDMGIIEPYMVAYWEFGDELADIPIPKGWEEMEEEREEKAAEKIQQQQDLFGNNPDESQGGNDAEEEEEE